MLFYNSKFELVAYRSCSRICTVVDALTCHPTAASFNLTRLKLQIGSNYCYKQIQRFRVTCLFTGHVVTFVIVPRLLPTLFGNRGIFTHSPLLWVFETFSFCCYHIINSNFHGNINSLCQSAVIQLISNYPPSPFIFLMQNTGAGKLVIYPVLFNFEQQNQA